MSGSLFHRFLDMLGSLLGNYLVTSGSLFGHVGVIFFVFFGTCWDVFWDTFGRFSDRFGKVLGTTLPRSKTHIFQKFPGVCVLRRGAQNNRFYPIPGPKTLTNGKPIL